MHPVSSAALVGSLQWRYATKVFDSTRMIEEETWNALEDALILTPSSYGLQPWRFIVIADQEMKKQLRPHSWNQAQVTDCSHYVVFAAMRSLKEEDIDRFITRTAEVRGVTVDSMKGYRSIMISDIVHGPRGKTSHEWAARQAYIALGNFMTAAALLQVDTCPLEGFKPSEYDRVLGLEERGLTAAVCCAAGYRSPSDRYAGLPKVRFDRAELVERI